MFGTLRYGSQSNDAEFVDLTSEFLSNEADGGAAPHFACDVCRMKKLKCSGQKTGCDRCKVMSTSCVYPAIGDAPGRRRRRRGEDRSGAKSQRLASPSPSNPTNRVGNAMSPPGMMSSQHPASLSVEEVDDTAVEESSLRMLDEDIFMSDEFLFGLIPGFDPQRSEESGPNAESPLQLNPNESLRSTSGPLTTETGVVNESAVQMSLPFKAMRRSDASTYAHLTSSFSPSISTHSELVFSEQPTYRDKGEYSLPTASTATTESTASRASTASTNSTGSTTPVMPIVQKPKNVNSTNDSGAPFCCLQIIISLLENLEDVSDMIESSTLDSVLAFHKKTLTQCSALLRCEACATRSEYLRLFVLVFEKLMNSCERMVNEYLRRPRGRFEMLIEKRSGTASVGMASQRKLSIGKYEIDLPVELDSLFKVLMALQLKALGGILTKFRRTISLSRHQAKLAQSFNGERKLEALIQKLQRSNALVEP